MARQKAVWWRGRKLTKKGEWELGAVTGMVTGKRTPDRACVAQQGGMSAWDLRMTDPASAWRSYRRWKRNPRMSVLYVIQAKQ
mmetsp:Transcript_52901/g.146882  ORF Transcript_52901/g.146882 Transcript_52901/m.146882 type:complete len:83 (+) Transcript_52901:2043-2291(+)